MVKCARMSDFSIRLPDHPGELARLAARLRAADVNLIGLWGYGGADGASFYCVPEKADQFRSFAESAELDVTEGTTFYLSGTDHVGALVRTLEMISGAGINLHAIQIIAFNGDFGAFVWSDPASWSALTRVLDETP